MTANVCQRRMRYEIVSLSGDLRVRRMDDPRTVRRHPLGGPAARRSGRRRERGPRVPWWHEPALQAGRARPRGRPVPSTSGWRALRRSRSWPRPLRTRTATAGVDRAPRRARGGPRIALRRRNAAGGGDLVAVVLASAFDTFLTLIDHARSSAVLLLLYAAGATRQAPVDTRPVLRLGSCWPSLLDDWAGPATVIWVGAPARPPVLAGRALRNRARPAGRAAREGRAGRAGREARAREAAEEERNRIASELQAVVANGAQRDGGAGRGVPRVLAAGDTAAARRRLRVDRGDRPRRPGRDAPPARRAAARGGRGPRWRRSRPSAGSTRWSSACAKPGWRSS